MADTIAILFGLNYRGSQYELNGCINDTNIVKGCLRKYIEVPDHNITMMTDDTPIKPSKDNMIKALRDVVNTINENTSYKKLWVHFSGHGSYVRDTDGDEDDKRDEVICTLDNNYIKDDELNDIFSEINTDKQLICIFDCCHSGTSLDLPFRYNYNTNKYESIRQNSGIKCDAILLSGCKDDQYSADAYGISQKYTYTGAFSTALMKCCQKWGTISYDNLMDNCLKYLKERNFPQIPQITCSKTRNMNETFIHSEKWHRVSTIMKRFERYIRICHYYYTKTGNIRWLNYKNYFVSKYNNYKRDIAIV